MSTSVSAPAPVSASAPASVSVPASAPRLRALLASALLSALCACGGSLDRGPCTPLDVSAAIKKTATRSNGHVWSKRFGDTKSLYVSAIAVDSLGSALITGYINVYTTSERYLRDIFALKISAAGDLVWQKQFEDEPSERAERIAVDPSGNALIAAVIEAPDHRDPGGDDVQITKLDPDGALLWKKRFGGPDDQGVSALAVDLRGNVILAGYLHGSIDLGGGPITSAGSRDVFVAKLDPEGRPLWAQRLGARGFIGELFSHYQHANALAVDAAGNIFVAGVFGGKIDFGVSPSDDPYRLQSSDGYDAFVAKFNPQGEHVWRRRLPGVDDQAALGVAVDSAGAAWVTGTMHGAALMCGGSVKSAGASDAFVMKLDSSGRTASFRRFGDDSAQHAVDVAVDASGAALVAVSGMGSMDFGGGPLPGGGEYGVFVAKLNP